MSESANEFKEWMDRLGLSARDVAKRMHMAEQTVRIWRSSGVPSRKRPAVAQLMEEWENSPTGHSDGQIFTLKMTDDQYRRWSEAAANSKHKNLLDWAMDELNKAATEYIAGDESLISLVAEESADYDTDTDPKKKSA